MATLTAQPTDENGVNPLVQSAATGGGDVFANTGSQLLLAENSDAASKTVTIAGQASNVDVPGYGKLDQADVVTAVAAGKVAVIGPFPQRGFNNSSGQVAITYSAVTSLTVAVISVP